MKTELSVLKLFNVLPITKEEEKHDEDLAKLTIKHGFVYSPIVIANYSKNDLISLIKEIGISSKQLNSSFHKSWKKIQNTDLETLVVEQLAHYTTTYGKEMPFDYLAEKEIQWGVDNLAQKVLELKDFDIDKMNEPTYVYIPLEKLDLPKIDIDSFQLIIIAGNTWEQIKGRTLALLNSGIALSKETLENIYNIVPTINISEKEIKEIKNKEAKSYISEMLGIVPENPIEFLRLVIKKTTGSTLIIKNKESIEKIKKGTNSDTVKLFKDYEKKYGLNRLSEIFLRFKPLFLAFREDSDMKPIINRIRRLAIKNHKPMPEDYLNNVTGKMNRGEAIVKNKLVDELERVNTFRKIRLISALNYRTSSPDSIIYKVRNGKGYATDFDFSNPAKIESTLKIVKSSIANDIRAKVEGKKIYIPEYIKYTLPSTEKQFIGGFPSGTCVKTNRNIVVGVYWEDIKGYRIDLDLSLMTLAGDKIGWDGMYRTGTTNNSILFSGDMTSASQGATELFRIPKQRKEISYLISVNYYNYNKDVVVPFKIIVGNHNRSDLPRSFMVNPNDLLISVDSEISVKQKVLGLVVSSPDENRFYLDTSNTGKSISARKSEATEKGHKYLITYHKNSLDLEDFLIEAGAIMVDDEADAEINLSTKTLGKDTILNLLIE
jgi:hypothetical protein